MFSSDADLFFRNPHEPKQASGVFGTLYLLRRDIFVCLGEDPDSGEPIERKVLWPGAMAILAGVDLLAKFHCGSDTGPAGERFKEFLDAYFDLGSTADRETLYQLRCSLLHSFGLYSHTKSGVYHFVVTGAGEELVTELAGDMYLVDLATLHARFEAAARAYQADLESSVSLQTQFTGMFTNYGAIKMGVNQV